MFAAYLDESFDNGNNGNYVVAAVVGDGWKILKGERLWGNLLRKHRLKTFKASRLKRRPDILLEFASAIMIQIACPCRWPI